jgi:UDP-4-amino-4,6-dideoxy-N-acetyl-beta-L-altrosamine transaminase
MKIIPYGRQDITQSDIDSVVAVLKSDFLTQGPKVPSFEQHIAEYCGASHAVAVNSATSALHLACLSLGVGKGDSVWTSPVTFVASANCALYCGAKVDFVDIDPRSYNLCPDALEKKLIKARSLGCLPKVIIPVHLCGQSCDMERIFSLSKEYNFKIIEDASHAIGGKYQNKPIGDCRYSDITIFSFHPVKIITTAEGGMAVTNNKDLYTRLSTLRSHGITRDIDAMTHESDGPWYYQQIDLGFNYRMTELQAALGLSQLVRLDDYVSRRHVLAERYDNLLAKMPLILPYQGKTNYSSYHLYVIRLKNHTDGNHRRVFELLRDKGVGVNLHYIPVYAHPYYKAMGFDSADFPMSESYYSSAISIPLFPGMSFHEQDSVVSALIDSL